jgi:hypothetical protein
VKKVQRIHMWHGTSAQNQDDTDKITNDDSDVNVELLVQASKSWPPKLIEIVRKSS